MNEEELRAAAFLLFQKVKIAVAVVVIRLTPNTTTVMNYATIFQRKFRKTTKRINLQLERQMFYEQLLLLLPALKIYTTENRSDYGEPMDVDDIPHSNDSVNYPGLLTYPVNEEFSNFIHMLTTTSQFFDAIMETKFLSEKNASITKNDILQLLSKFQETSMLQLVTNNEANHEYYSCISNSLLNYVIKSFDMDRIIDESTTQIMKLLQEYFDRSPLEIINTQGYFCIRYANEVLQKYFKNYPNEDRNRSLISKFVQKTAHKLLRKERDLFCYWYMLLGDWNNNKHICISILDSLFSVIGKEYNNQNMILENLCGLLYSIKKLLITFYKLHNKPNGCRNAETETFGKSFLKPWETILKTIIVSSIDKKQQLVSQLSWNCLQVIMLLKCRFRSGNEICYDFKN